MGMLGNLFRGLIGKPRLNTRIHHGYSQYQKSDGTWEYTHRSAAEKKLGGKINKGFVVHHKDGNKGNNSWWNLWVMPRDKHSALHAKKGRYNG